VTYAKKLSKDEALIRWSDSAQAIDRQIRAFNPWPVAETRLDGTQLRIWQAQLHSTAGSSAIPGTVLSADDKGIKVATGQGVINLTQVQAAGRKAIAAAEFVRAHSLVGQTLGGAA
jgi:methionyl-tRNA formyltransferase